MHGVQKYDVLTLSVVYERPLTWPGATSHLVDDDPEQRAPHPNAPVAVVKTAYLEAKDAAEREEMAMVLDSAPHASRKTGRFTAQEVYDCVLQERMHLSRARQSVLRTDRSLEDEREQHEIAKAQVANLNERLKEATTTASSAEKQLEDLANTMISKSEMDSQLEQARNEGQSTEASRSAAELGCVREQHEKELNEMTGRHQARESEVVEELQVEKNRVKEMTDQLAEMETTLAGMQRAQSSQYARESNDLAVKDATIIRLQRDAEAHGAEMADQLQHARALDETISLLENTAADDRVNRDNMEQGLRNDVETLRKDIKDVKNDLEQAKSDAAMAQERLGILNSETIPEIQNEAAGAVEEAMKSAAEMIDGLETELEDLRAAASDKDGRISTLETSVSDMESQLNHKAAEVETLNQNVSSRLSECVQLQSKVKTLEQKIEELSLTTHRQHAALKARPVDAPPSSDPAGPSDDGNSFIRNIAAEHILSVLLPLVGIRRYTSPNRMLSEMSKAKREVQRNLTPAFRIDGGEVDTDWSLAIISGTTLVGIPADDTLARRLWLVASSEPCNFMTCLAIIERTIQHLNRLQFTPETVWMMQDSARKIGAAAMPIITEAAESPGALIATLAAFRSIEVILRAQRKAVFDHELLARLHNQIFDHMHRLALTAALITWAGSALMPDRISHSPASFLMTALQNEKDVLRTDEGKGDDHRVVARWGDLYAVIDPDKRRIATYGKQELDLQQGLQMRLSFTTSRLEGQKSKKEAMLLPAVGIYTHLWVVNNMD